MKDTYYFSHDSNARRDPKIQKMRLKYKYGYQWYFMILEILREQSGYKYKMDNDSYTILAQELDEKVEEIEKFIQDCVKEFKLFCISKNVLYSKSLIRRMKKKDEKSAIARQNALKRWNKEDASGNAVAMQSHSNRNALKYSKVKKSKVNNSKVNNGIGNANSTTHDFKDFHSLFELTFGNSPDSVEKNQIAIISKEYDLVPMSKQYEIFKSLITKMRDGPAQKRTKGYLFGVFKLKLQDYCAENNIKEANLYKKTVADAAANLLKNN